MIQGMRSEISMETEPRHCDRVEPGISRINPRSSKLCGEQRRGSVDFRLKGGSGASLPLCAAAEELPNTMLRRGVC